MKKALTDVLYSMVLGFCLGALYDVSWKTIITICATVVTVELTRGVKR